MARKEIKHYLDNDKQFAAIDKDGGWPVEATWLILIHGCGEKMCYYTMSKNPINDGWNTRTVSADDYYWWKLTAERQQKEAEKIRNNIGDRIRHLSMAPPKPKEKPKKCGDCATWMIPTCPREKPQNGTSAGPSMNDHPCSKFASKEPPCQT